MAGGQGTAMTRRDFNGLMASSAAVTGLGIGLPSSAALETEEITWVSDDPHLSGSFAPVGREVDAADLPVIAGRIPPELSGVYMRNGPNPLFKPVTYTYPLDGDGMIHAVYLDNGRARYRNRFVQTKSLGVERRVRSAVYGGFARPTPVDPSLVGSNGHPGPVKNGAFINIIRHGGHLLALDEASPCYEMSVELETIGLWKAGTEKPITLGAHNRRHPTTGALFALAYSVMEPTVRLHHIDASGNLVRTFAVALAAPTMIHDFVLTEHYIVLLAGPAVFDWQAARSGQPLLQWRPSLATRIGIIGLDGAPAIWLEADPFFVFHFANAFERGSKIIVDYVQHERFGLGYAAARRKVPTLHRLDIDLSNRTLNDAQLADMVVEFPRINDGFNALPTRYVYLPTLTDALSMTNPPSSTFNTMLKVDTETGKIARHDFGNRIAGEAAFIPRGLNGEDDGYLAIFAFDPAGKTSDFVLLDAAHLDAEPVTVLRLPQRVPQGLHGSWIPRA
jgi:carotenoid cleavage dioxygenase-like enzyme